MKADWSMGSIHPRKSWTKSLGIVPETERNRPHRNRWRKRPRKHSCTCGKEQIWVKSDALPTSTTTGDKERTHFPAPLCSNYTGTHTLNNIRRNLQDIFWHCPQCEIKVQPYCNCKWQRAINNRSLNYKTNGLLYTWCHLLYHGEPILSSFDPLSSFPRRKAN